jgi:hypothetical protein
MSAGTGMGIDLTMVSVGVGNAQLPLGFIHTQPANQDGEGERTFIYVGLELSLAQNTAVQRQDGTYDSVVATGGVGFADDNIMVGTLFNDMTNATLNLPVASIEIRFGFAQRTGNGTALTNTAGAIGLFGNTASTEAAAAGELAVAPAAGAPGENGVGLITSVSVETDPGVSGIFFLPLKLWCKG